MESRITTIGEMMCILVANNGSIVCRITDALDFYFDKALCFAWCKNMASGLYYIDNNWWHLALEVKKKLCSQKMVWYEAC